MKKAEKAKKTTRHRRVGLDEIVKHFRVYAFYEATDNLNEFPSVHASKKDCLENSRSFHGHPCDNPLKRGVLAEGELTLKIPPMIKTTDDLREYVRLFRGSLAVQVIGDPEYNKKSLERTLREQKRMLRKLGA